MSEVTHLIHQYLRHNKKFPHVFCPGCGHGIVLGSLIRGVHSLNLNKDDVCIVAGIGCSGRIAAYVDFSTVHTTHGRALTFATGIKMANPKLKVIAIMGDGDALSIGGNHLIHAARRNISITALVLNNNIYGMTGGQCSPTTPQGAFAMTSPYGALEKPFDVVDLVSAAGANYVARGTSFHANMLDRLITDAIDRPGFNLVEVITPCHTQFGRKNKFKTGVDMYKWIKSTCTPLEAYNKLSENKRKEKMPTGVFVDHQAPGMEERYYEMTANLQEAEMSSTNKIDRFEIRLSGLGGQGIITLGRVMGTALALSHGFYVTQTQSYGPEARGGASRTDLVISTDPISYPKAESVDLLVALSQEACNKYYRNMKPHGVLLVETDLVKQPPSNVFVGLPFTQLAKDRLGLVQAMNTIVLGALTYLLPFAQPRLMKKALEENLPPKIVPTNLKAFNLGQSQAKKHFGPAPEIWKGAAEQDDEEMGD